MLESFHLRKLSIIYRVPHAARGGFRGHPPNKRHLWLTLSDKVPCLPHQYTIVRMKARRRAVSLLSLRVIPSKYWKTSWKSERIYRNLTFYKKRSKQHHSVIYSFFKWLILSLSANSQHFVWRIFRVLWLPAKSHQSNTANISDFKCRLRPKHRLYEARVGDGFAYSGASLWPVVNSWQA